VTVAARALEGRCALVTGASRGLGLAIAEAYLRAGASLAICARDEQELASACSNLQAMAGAGQAVIAMRADIARASEVESLVQGALTRLGRLDVLVNNAAIAGPIGALEQNDWSDWVHTIEINLLGAVLLCRALLPHFKRAGRGKIIQLSGGGATQPMANLSAYATSKAAVVRFIETLAEETRAHRIDINALAPGMLSTRLLQQLLAAGPERLGHELYARALQQYRDGGVPLARGAELAVFLGSSRSDGITGKLISAVWDPWEKLPEHLSDLASTDIYTLRRIVPADRDLGWGERE
jgi:NAD(P)-dependent dehydrogenase (short-subunit alcohol dehydrogenase family)